MVDEGPKKKKFRDEANSQYRQKNKGRNPPKSISDLNHPKKGFAHADYSELGITKNDLDLSDSYMDREDVTESVRMCSLCNNIKKTPNTNQLSEITNASAPNKKNKRKRFSFIKEKKLNENKKN